MNKIHVCILASLLLIFSSGCATSFHDNRRLNMEPLFNYDKDLSKESTEFDAIGPFFSLRSKPEEKEYGLRPFFYVRKNEEEHFKEVEYLYPLGKYRSTKEETDSYFLPLFSSHTDTLEGKENPSDFGFFPIFWGKDQENKGYGGFFPFYGRLSHRFGKDQIHFFLWPLYSDSKDGDSYTYNILWPIFSRTTGGEESGFRIWPLYGQMEKEGEYSKYFALWPIFFFQETNLDTDNPVTFSAIFPFYLNKSSLKGYSRSFLWPFFNYTVDRTKNYTSWDMPWPILHRSEGEGIQSFRFFPIYGYKKKRNSKSGFFLWPIYTYRKNTFEDHEEKTYRFFLINKYQKKIWDGGFKNGTSIRIWPLFFYDRKEDGTTRFSWPEIIPLDDDGFERNWAPFFRLYQYNRDRDGNTESKFLWGLYRHKKSESREFYEISLLYSYEKEEDVVFLSILKGLFEYQNNGVESSIKLFYLPWKIRWQPDISFTRQNDLSMNKIWYSDFINNRF